MSAHQTGESVVVKGLYGRAAETSRLSDGAGSKVRVEVVEVHDGRAVSLDRRADESAPDVVVGVAKRHARPVGDGQSVQVFAGELEGGHVGAGLAQKQDLRVEDGILPAGIAIPDVAQENAHQLDGGTVARTPIA
jgi:hypothetical protein